VTKIASAETFEARRCWELNEKHFPSCRMQLFFASGTWKAAKATASDRHNKITFVSVVQAFPHKKLLSKAQFLHAMP